MLFYLVMLCIVGMFAGMVVGVVGLATRHRSLALGGFIAGPVCLVVAIGIGFLNIALNW